MCGVLGRSPESNRLGQPDAPVDVRIVKISRVPYGGNLSPKLREAVNLIWRQGGERSAASNH